MSLSTDSMPWAVCLSVRCLCLCECLSQFKIMTRNIYRAKYDLSTDSMPLPLPMPFPVKIMTSNIYRAKYESFDRQHALGCLSVCPMCHNLSQFKIMKRNI